MLILQSNSIYELYRTFLKEKIQSAENAFHPKDKTGDLHLLEFDGKDVASGRVGGWVGDRQRKGEPDHELECARA